MDFFGHQQQARAATRRLLLLFALAVIGVVLAVNGVILLAARAAGIVPAPWVHGLVSGALLALILGGTLVESIRLRAGGPEVARMVDARPVDAQTADPFERRLRHVVEEMALASGTPVPRVYLMADEAGINAFAAGNTLQDAVVAVTRGALTRLTRDELQGVVAHEFSHILNGDMRLNMRMIAMIYGLTLVSSAGRLLLRAAAEGRDSKAATPVGLAGIGLWTLGAIGVFFSRLINAALSRQREYLADASAVQFTRNPDGIGGALRRIGGFSTDAPAVLGKSARRRPGLGSAIAHHHARTLSPIFLGAASAQFMAGAFATHPPLTERLRRIYGRSVSLLDAPEQPLPGAEPAAAEPPAAARQAAGAISPLAPLARGAAALPSSIGHALAPADAKAFVESWRERIQALGLDTALQDPPQARLLTLAMLLDKGASVALAQRRIVIDALGASAGDALGALHAAVATLPPGGRLPLLDLAMPALQQLSLAESDGLLRIADALIAADGRLSLPEFLLLTTLRRRIGSAARARVRPIHRSLRELPDEAALVLSLIAHLRSSRPASEAFAAGRVFLEGMTPVLQPLGALTPASLGPALARLNQLMPLAKPALVKACAAAAWDVGSRQVDWRAASALRTLCTALDAPLPPMTQAAIDSVH
ncbi:MAG: M48 family metallopeptidase [Betaproteobacteria bacterium]|nr:M48 family metallopeptidase [Betaproteobacteria bacterium]